MSLEGYVRISSVIKYSFTLRLLFDYFSRKGFLSCHFRTLIWLFKQEGIFIMQHLPWFYKMMALQLF